MIIRAMNRAFVRQVRLAKIATMSLLGLLAITREAALTQDKQVSLAAELSPERIRANFGRPVQLTADDVRAFPDAPAGFDKPRDGKLSGRTEVLEYDSTVTGVKRKALEELIASPAAAQKQLEAPLSLLRQQRPTVRRPTGNARLFEGTQHCARLERGRCQPRPGDVGEQPYHFAQRLFR